MIDDISYRADEQFLQQKLFLFTTRPRRASSISHIQSKKKRDISMKYFMPTKVYSETDCIAK